MRLVPWLIEFVIITQLEEETGAGMGDTKTNPEMIAETVFEGAFHDLLSRLIHPVNS